MEKRSERNPEQDPAQAAAHIESAHQILETLIGFGSIQVGSSQKQSATLLRVDPAQFRRRQLRPRRWSAL
jgi:hypothetical protein